MAVLNWPPGRAFTPRLLTPGVRAPKTGWRSFFTGQFQGVGHLADRYRFAMVLPPCDAVDGQYREAFFFGMVSTGDWVRLPHLHRSAPLGSMRGLPVVALDTAAGARTVPITTTAGATLAGGDVLSSGNQVLMVAAAGAVASGLGLAQVPLVLPLAQPLAQGTAVNWASPTGTFQLAGVDALDVEYARGRWQAALELSFVQAL